MSPSPTTLEDVLTRVRSLIIWLNTEAGEVLDDATLLADALNDPQRRRSMLLLLTVVPPERTEFVIDRVVPLAASDRDAVITRQLLGRLSRHTSRQLVPPLVDALLDDADDHEYRRFAELLDFLGLKEALSELCHRANTSQDEGIREVATDFGQ